MLFSGRLLAQRVTFWSCCLTVMVSKVCLKLRKRRKVGGNWEWQQRTFWSKGTCIISFCIDIISCWRQRSPAKGQRSKQAEGLQMAFLGWSHFWTPPQSSDTQWCQGKATADIISSSALSSLCVDGIQHVFKEPFLWAAQLCGPRVHATHSLPIEDSCSKMHCSCVWQTVPVKPQAHHQCA